MNLPAISRLARDIVFDVTDSIAISGTYYHVVAGAYNVTTGTSSNTVTQFVCGARSAMFMQKEIDGDRIKAGDKKLIFKTSEVTIVPTIDDYFVDSGGTRWDVMIIGTEPTNSVLILRGRAHAN